MRIAIAICFALLMAMPAQAGIFTSTEDRAAQINATVAGNNSYNAHLTRKLTSIAEEEKYQHDTGAAQAFIELAEKYARKAGGK
ncbi:MAG: hypothetical protein R8L53_01090 [Mariprofundales bacterium]